jgi:nucleoside-diphosphate-sugar epimerase
MGVSMPIPADAERETYLVTGSSGFIGTHVCARASQFLPADSLVHGLDLAQPISGVAYHHIHGDIRSALAIGGLPPGDPTAVIHLAARAEVLMPFEELGDLSTSNVNGTANVLSRLAPRRFVFASSSAVYGSVSGGGVGTDLSNVKPVGAYGLSKLFAEMICAEWCREKQGAAAVFRFGNVVGSRCRGLIPYLVKHTLEYPEGDVQAQCKGRGVILRDYVPVDYIVELLWAAARKPWEPGTFRAFNAGTGRGLTNGDVGAIVTKTLTKLGYRLNINWDAPLGAGESTSIVLGIEETVETFGISPPDQEGVVASIERAVLSWFP